MLSTKDMTNPPELFRPTKVRVLNAFHVGGGKVAEVGSVVSIPAHLARELAAIGKAEILQ